VSTWKSTSRMLCLLLRTLRQGGPLCSLHCSPARSKQRGEHHSSTLSHLVTGPLATLQRPLCSRGLREHRLASSVWNLLPSRFQTV
jgi:hypothetical protein